MTLYAPAVTIEATMQNRLLALILALAISIGLIFGLLLGIGWSNRLAPADPSISLDTAGQDDYIIAVAEAYASDGDLQLAQDRLARLHSEDILARVENLAGDYVPQFDLVSQRLAMLAVALGSTNPTIIVLSVPEAPMSIQVSYEPSTEQPAVASNEILSPESSVTLIASALPGKTPKAAAQGAPAQPIPAGQTLPPSLDATVAQAPAPMPRPGASPTLVKVAKAKTPASKTNPPTFRQPASAKRPIVAYIPVKLPDYVGAPAGSIPLTARPSKCTPASQMPAVIDQPIMLCPRQEYAPFRVSGENITIYGDKSALVRGQPRGFGITVTGTNITLFNVNVAGETDPGDLNSWLCMYESCSFKTWAGRGGVAYGGGILLDHTTNASVVSATVSGGTIGVASLGGSSNKIVNNNLSNLNGWGVFLAFAQGNYVVGNTLNNNNRACLDPDGNYVQSGCESAGWMAIRSEANFVVNNHCEHGANCYYTPGNGGYSSNNNKFFNNYCAAAGNNCFEITFSQGNTFDYNVTGPDPKHPQDKCDYPFWISGSIVHFGPHNTWNCKHDGEQSLNDSRRGTGVTTGIEWR